jgi:hypothetical protein
LLFKENKNDGMINQRQGRSKLDFIIFCCTVHNLPAFIPKDRTALDSAKRPKRTKRRCRATGKGAARERKADAPQVSRRMNGGRPLGLSSVYPGANAGFL